MCIFGDRKNKEELAIIERAESDLAATVSDAGEEADSRKAENAEKLSQELHVTESAPQKKQTAEEKKEEPTRGAFYSSSRVFGKSEGELEAEFKDYKTRRLFKKISLMLTDPYMPKSEFDEKLETAVSLGLGGVSVLYDRLDYTLKKVKGAIEVNVCVCFPYAADDVKSKIAAVKNCVKTGVDAIEIPINLTDVSERNIRSVERDYRKLRALAKNKNFILIAELSKMTPTDSGLLARICRAAGITWVKTSCALPFSRIDDYALNNHKAVLKGQAEVIACSSTDNADGVVSVFAIGAERFAGTEAIAIAKSLKKTVI